jgi:hypothetical protein
VGEEPFVVAVRRSILDNVLADPLSWQDLTIFSFKSEQIHKLSRWTDREQALIRGTNNQWQWVTGSGPINTANVQSLLNTLASLHATHWVANAPAAAFERPQVVITFTTSADDKAQHKLTLGVSSPDGTAMARTDEHEGTFAISSPNSKALRADLVEPASPSPTASVSPSLETSPAVAMPTP